MFLQKEFHHRELLEKNLVEDLEIVPSWLEQTNLQNQIKNIQYIYGCHRWHVLFV
jgi:hypothetical protein